MIPYDDLVAALSAWRASQGLPVSTMGSAGSGQSAQPGSGPTPAPMPATKSGSGPKTAPPPPRTKGTSVPPPLAAVDTVEEVEDSAMLDEQSYDNEGNDFAMNFGGGRGEAPASRDSVQTDPVGAYPTGRRKPEDEW